MDEGFVKLFEATLEASIQTMVKQCLAEEIRWEHGGIAILVKERAKKLLDTDPELQEILRKAVLESISTMKHPNK